MAIYTQNDRATNQIRQADDLKALKMGLFWSEVNPHTLAKMQQIESLLSYDSVNNKFKFVSSNAYNNLFYQTTVSNINQLKDILLAGYDCNYFPEILGDVGAQISGKYLASLADIKNGLYDSKINILLDRIVNFWEVENPNLTPTVTRILYMHEWNLQVYPWGMGYNQTDTQDWYSTTQTTAGVGRNDPADLILAFNRLGDLIKNHDAWKKGYVKRVITCNATWSSRYKLKDFLPARDKYDYIGIDLYDRLSVDSYQYSSMKATMLTGRNRIYKQITEFTDAPILITESGSGSNPTQNTFGFTKSANAKYFRSKFLINAWNDIIKYMPQVVEYLYFRDRTATIEVNNWHLTNQDWLDFKPHLHKRLYRQEVNDELLNINQDIKTKDLTQTANWLTGGANVGTFVNYVNTNTVGGNIANAGYDAGLDGGGLNRRTIGLTFNGGTDELNNYFYWQEAGTWLTSNTPHTLSFYAWTNKDDANMLVGITGDTTFAYSGTTAFAGSKVNKIQKGWNKYSINLWQGYFPAPTLTNFIFGIGGQNYFTTLPTLTPVLTANAVSSVTITNPGAGIEDGDYILQVTGGGGTGARIEVFVSLGIVVSATVIAGGSGYTSAPTLSLTPKVLLIDVDSIKLERGEEATPKVLELIGASTPTNIATTLFKQFNFVTVTNTIVETTLVDITGATGSRTLGANSMALNDRYKIEIVGRYSTGATANPVTLKVKLGATILANPDLPAITLPVSQTNAQFRLTFVVRIGALGATGSGSVDAELVYDNGTSSDTFQRWTTAGSDTIDTTIANAFDLTAQWTTASATESIQVRDMVITKY